MEAAGCSAALVSRQQALHRSVLQKKSSAFFCLCLFLFFTNSTYFFSLHSPLQKIPGKFKKLFTELESLTVSTALAAKQSCSSLPTTLLSNLCRACLSLELEPGCVRSEICCRPCSPPKLRGGLEKAKKKQAVLLTAGGRAE